MYFGDSTGEERETSTSCQPSIFVTRPDMTYLLTAVLSICGSNALTQEKNSNKLNIRIVFLIRGIISKFKQPGDGENWYTDHRILVAFNFSIFQFEVNRIGIFPAGYIVKGEYE